MSFVKYFSYFLIAASVISVIAYLLGAPLMWIGIGAVIILGLGIFTGRE